MKELVKFGFMVLFNTMITIWLAILSSSVVGKTWWTVLTCILSAVVVCEDLKEFYRLYKSTKTKK